MSHPINAAIAMAVAFAPIAAAAEQRHLATNGTTLAIDTSCARTVGITPDPSLNGRIELLASAEDGRELNQLNLRTEGSTAKLDIAPNTECWRPGLDVDGVRLGIPRWKPTLDIVIRVPPASPLAIEESGSVIYRIGPIGGKLTASLSGNVDLAADSVIDAHLEIAGSGAVRIRKLQGDLDLQNAGSASFQLDGGTLQEAKLDLAGTGDVTLAAGAITNLAVESGGTGKLTAGGRINKASLDLSGAGGVALSQASIGDLALQSSGSAELRVTGTVGNASIDLSGSGDVYLPPVTGKLNQANEGSGSVHVGGN